MIISQYPMFAALSRFNKTGVPFFAAGGDNVDVDYGDGNLARNTPALVVSGEAFRILQVNAYAGRLLTPEDDIRGIPHGANCVLSYRLWKSRFHGDPSAIGRHITIGVVRFTIVGVAPRRFFGIYVGAHSDLILPMTAYAATNPAVKILDARGWTWLVLMARVPPSIGIKRLSAGLNTIYPAVRHESAFSAEEEAKPDRLYTESLANGVSAIRQRFSEPLYILLAMTSLILLIACANVANLLLARSVARYREMAMRLSLGAKRSRILRQLLTESALIAALGAALGVPVYFACTRGLVAFLRSGSDSIFLDTGADWRFVAAAAGVVCCTILLFGFAPAVRVTRCDLNIALSESSGRLAAKSALGKSVVTVQISLSLVLLLAAVLLSRSLYELRTFNPGFRRDHILIAEIDTTQSIHRNAEVVRFFDELIRRVQTLPGVRSAAASVVVPLSGMSWQDDYQIRRNSAPGIVKAHSFINWVTPGYFETMGARLIRGRKLNEADGAKGSYVAVANESFAKRYLGGSPIGEHFYEKDGKDAIWIVGVAGDARYRNLRDDPPTIYRPLAQIPAVFEFPLQLHLEVWTATPAGSLTAPVREIAKRLNNSVVVDTQAFDSLVDASLLYERLLTALSAGFGLIGLMLSAIGVYGLSAYSVARRTPEMGIRMALGATPKRILRLILSEHARLLAIGTVAGLLLSVALTRFIRAWLFGVSALDPVLFVASVAALSAIALLAAFVPARRAARLNPMAALRHE